VRAGESSFRAFDIKARIRMVEKNQFVMILEINHEEVNMRRAIKIGSWAATLVIAVGPMAGVSAVTVEVAKTCQILTEKAFPPRQIGNPAAGSAKGTAKDNGLISANVSRTVKRRTIAARMNPTDVPVF
jgi:hypothetical protein